MQYQRVIIDYVSLYFYWGTKFLAFLSFFLSLMLALQYEADLYKTTSVMKNQQEENVFFSTPFTYSPYYQMTGLKIKKDTFR